MCVAPAVVAAAAVALLVAAAWLAVGLDARLRGDRRSGQRRLATAAADTPAPEYAGDAD